jgi:hypothetical protein
MNVTVNPRFNLNHNLDETQAMQNNPLFAWTTDLNQSVLSRQHLAIADNVLLLALFVFQKRDFRAIPKSIWLPPRAISLSHSAKRKKAR